MTRGKWIALGALGCLALLGFAAASAGGAYWWFILRSPMRLEKSPVATGESAHVRFARPLPASDGRYWITIVPVGTPDAEYGSWSFVPPGATQAPVPAARRPGAYEIRLHDRYPRLPSNVRWRIPLDVVGEPIQVSTPPAAATPATEDASLLPAVVLEALGEGETFRWTDEDWILRLRLSIHNPTSEPVSLPLGRFEVLGDDRPMRPWTPAGTLRDPVEIPPGGTIEGYGAWYYSRSYDAPRRGVVKLGDVFRAEFDVTQIERPR